MASGTKSKRKAVAGSSKTVHTTMSKLSSSDLVLSNKKSTSMASEQQKQHQNEVDDEIHLGGDGGNNTSKETAGDSSADSNLINTSPYGNGLGGMGLGMYGGGMMGMGMMPGMYGMGMYSGMGGMMPGSQWIFSLNQFLFGIQSVVFSLGQAVQIVGMNAQQLRHVYESIKCAIDNALEQVNQRCKISSWEDIDSKREGAMRWVLGDDDLSAKNNCVGEDKREGREEHLSLNQVVRRRRVAAFRWTMTLAVSYVAYRTLRRLIRFLFLGRHNIGVEHRNSPYLLSYPMQPSRSYYRNGGVGNQYFGNSIGGMTRNYSYDSGNDGMRYPYSRRTPYDSYQHCIGSDYY